MFSGLLEGEDKFTNESLRAVYNGLHDLVLDGGFDYGIEVGDTPVRYDIDFIGGGDMVYINEILGGFANFCSDDHNCVWCEVSHDHLKDLPQTDDLNESGAQTRTYDRLCWLAHIPSVLSSTKPKPQFPFTCPGCRKVFTSQEVRHQFLECSSPTVDLDHFLESLMQVARSLCSERGS